jgi:hypothetical protein
LSLRAKRQQSCSDNESSGEHAHETLLRGIALFASKTDGARLHQKGSPRAVVRKVLHDGLL